jgi:hypothetical protein
MILDPDLIRAVQDTCSTPLRIGGIAVRRCSTDVYLACSCPECGGRAVRLTLRKFRGLSRLTSPWHEQAVHELVSRGGDTLPDR